MGFSKNKPQGARIHTIHSDPACKHNVIFIHGLDGSWDRSWGFERQENWSAWIKASGIGANVLSVDYPNASSAWRGSAMALYDRANTVLALLAGKGAFDQPYVLVGHSMGGLLVKQMARVAEQSDANREAFRNCRGIEFVATPHTGSDIATLATYLRFFLGTTVAVEELRTQAAALRDLNAWFRQYVAVKQILVHVLYETLPVGPIMVVDIGSSDPGIAGVIPVAIAASHIDIARPISADDEAAVILLSALKQFFSDSRARGPRVAGNHVQDVRASGNVVINQIWAPDKPDFS